MWPRSTPPRVAEETISQNGDGPGQGAGKDEKAGYLFFATEQGVVKRITLTDFVDAVSGAPTVISIAPKDRLGWVFATAGNQEVVLVTARGQAIRFSEEDVRSMGLAAGGVGGVKLKKGDKVIYAALVDPQGELMTLTEAGFTKRTTLSDYSTQGRNGGGIVTHKPNTRTGPVSAALLLPSGIDEETLVAVTRKGVPKLFALTDIPVMGRGVQGKVLVDVNASDAVSIVHRIVPVDETPLSTVTPTNTPDAPPAEAKAPADGPASNFASWRGSEWPRGQAQQVGVCACQAPS